MQRREPAKAEKEPGLQAAQAEEREVPPAVVPM